MSTHVSLQQAKDGTAILSLKGLWDISALSSARSELERTVKKSKVSHIDASQIQSLDTAGAWLLMRLGREGTSISGLKPEHESILALVEHSQSPCPPMPETPGLLVSFLTHIGKATVTAYESGVSLLRFIGETAVTLFSCIANPKRLRLSSIVRHVNETGINAIPIVALIAFLISIVLTYQGASQLKRFGAEIFTINMVGVSVLREMGVLLTAIMVAGRSGSAFTAEIGVMKVNEEVDAMRVIGLNPFEILVLPRVLALAITLPLLTFIADMMGALGGMIICYVQLNIPPEQYIEQFRNSVKMSDFWVGMIKAPVFAFLIAVVGCMRGMEVSGSAESVGRLTTVSVVHSIFLVLLADALFSILFTNLGM